MVNCFVRNCGHTSRKSKCRYFSVPKDKSEFTKWQKLFGFTMKQFRVIHDPKVCSCHFTNHDKENLPTITNLTPPKTTFDDSLLCNKRKKRTPLSDLANLNCNKRFRSDIDDSLVDGDANTTNETYPAEIPDDLENRSQRFRTQIYDGDADTTNETDTAEIPVNDLENQSHRFRTEIFDNDSNKENIKVLIEENQNLRKKVEQDKSHLRAVTDQNETLRKKIVILGAQLKYSNHANMNRLKEENNVHEKSIEILTNRLMNLNLRFEFRFIEYSDEKVYLHTGLPNKRVFDILLKLVTRVPFQYYLGWSVKKIPAKEQLLMTLMKLKMNLKHFDLAQRFGCSVTTVSNIVTTWVLLLHEILFKQAMKNIPTRKKNKTCLPTVFYILSECRLVLDGVEIFCDKPLNMLKQKAAFSGYKHHCTCKALVGVAPNGFVTYVSDLYPGSISDKRLVDNSGILAHFVPGDMILADKGFLIADILPYGVDLNLPPFLPHWIA